jgi:putative ABC transport system permease protein
MALEAVKLDVRWSVRTLRKTPWASIAVVAILGCSVAAATVLGALFTAVVYDPPPVSSSDAIARVWRADSSRPAGHREPSAADFLEWQDAARTLTALTAWTQKRVVVGRADAAGADALAVSPEYFRLTGRAPRLGRPFDRNDFQGRDAAIISDRVWRERFGADERVLGRELTVEGEPRTVVGVMPADFWFPTRGVDVWLPLRIAPDAALVDIAGRLTANAGFAAVQSEFDVIVRRSPSPAAATDRVLVRSIGQEARIRLQPALAGLVLPAGAILLIACANISNLLVMRAVAREHELAIRMAIGASPSALARLSLAEAVVIGAAGAVAGFVVTIWTMPLMRFVSAGIPEISDAMHVGVRTALIAAVAALMAVVGSSVLPALRAWRRDVSPALAGAGRRPLLRSFQYTRADLFVVVQVGVAVALVVVSVLLARMLEEYTQLSRPAVDATVRAARLTMPAAMTSAERDATLGRIVEETAGVDGLAAIAAATALPGAGERRQTSVDSAGGPGTCRVTLAFVSVEYFATLRLPFERGSLAPGEQVVVSDTAARSCWTSTASSWRMRVPSGTADRWLPVTAVVRDIVGAAPARHPELRVGDPTMAWIVGPSLPSRTVYLLMRPREGATVAGPKIAEAVVRASAVVGVESPTTLEEGSRRGPRPLVLIIAAMSILALVLASAGVYAALSQSAMSRRVDLGVRLALGASSWQLVRAAVARDAPLVASGVAAGVVVTLWITAATWPALLAISVLDAQAWIAICGILACAGLAAALGPVLRAIGVDPVEVLRAE